MERSSHMTGASERLRADLQYLRGLFQRAKSDCLDVRASLYLHEATPSNILTLVTPQQPERTNSITLLLARVADGDKGALNELFTRTYAELRKLAQVNYCKGATHLDLNVTALVNAASLRLLEHNRLSAKNRVHFFNVMKRAMRDLIVDVARRENAQKRPPRQRRVAMAEIESDGDTTAYPLFELQAALDALEQADPEAAQVVSLHFYSGCSVREIARILGCSFTVARDNLNYGKAWLNRRLSA